MNLSFLGGAGQVTGSQYLVETGSTRFLVDCGFNQGTDDRGEINRHPFAFDPGSLDFVLLTHAHLDHCGLLPRLVREGFRGKIHCTGATLDLATIVLLDSAKIQEEDARFEERRYRRNRLPGPPPGPIYTILQAEQALARFEPHAYEEPVSLSPEVAVRFLDAGHILGAASLDIALTEEGVERRLAFSGDLGRHDRPILNDPVLPARAEVAVLESTYGARTHDPWDETLANFQETIVSTLGRGGHILIPSFTIGRVQDVLYCLSEMARSGQLGGAQVFVDSPMAAESTEAFLRHQEYFDAETRKRMASGRSPFEFPGLHFTDSLEESMALNDMEEPFIVIAGAGMCSGGRIRHHLHHHLEHPQDEILIVGYQAEETLGHEIVSGAENVEIFNQPHEVRAHVTYLDGFSAHAGQNGLVDWATKVVGQGQRLFLVHGEQDSLAALSALLTDQLQAEVTVPARGDSFAV